MKKNLQILTLLFLASGILTGQTLIGEFLGDIEYNWLGHSVDLSKDGKILTIGESQDDVAGSNAGKVRVYQNIAGNWEILGDIMYGDESGDSFGENLKLSPNGNLLAVKFHKNSPTIGKVRVYESKENKWTQVGATLSGDQSLDVFGSGLAFSGDGTRLAIGTRQDKEADLTVGSVKVFEFSNGNWLQIGQEFFGTNTFDYLGGSVALSQDGNVLAFGAYGHDSENGEDSGLGRIYKFDGTEWKQLGEDILGMASKDRLGTGISLMKIWIWSGIDPIAINLCP